MQGAVTEVIELLSPLIKNPIDGEEVKGSPLPRFDKTEIGSTIPTKSQQTQFKIMKGGSCQMCQHWTQD